MVNPEVLGPLSSSKKVSWADGLCTVELKAARSQARTRQKECGLNRPLWNPFAVPEIFFSEIKTLGCFASRSDWDEPGMPKFTEKFERAYPSFENDTIMVFRLSSPEDLVENKKWRIKEPPKTAQVVVPEVLLVPCLLSDSFGNRIGRGAGFYDRYLQTHKDVRAWGLLHSDYVMKEIPTHWLHAGDQKLHGVITEKSIIPTQENLL